MTNATLSGSAQYGNLISRYLESLQEQAATLARVAQELEEIHDSLESVQLATQEFLEGQRR